MICFIVAASQNGVIAAKGSIPWKIPGEQAYFKRITMGSPIVMGRKTYDAIARPLPGRTNYILTHRPDFHAEGCVVLHDVHHVREIARENVVFVIGGQVVFDALFPFADRVYLTVIHKDFAGDTYFPQLNEEEWEQVSSQEGPSDVLPHTFYIYDRRGPRSL